MCENTGFLRPIFSRLEQNLQFCPYTGEYRSVKIHILANFMQCEVKNVCKKKQEYSYFCYILFFQFALINNQSNAIFQAFALIMCVNIFVRVKGCTTYYSCKSVYHFLIPCTLLHLMITNNKLCCQQFISISMHKVLCMNLIRFLAI